MKIRTFYRLDLCVYRVSILREDWSENDIKLMEQFGEPEINVGGVLHYTPDGADPIEISLPDTYRRIKSDPISLSFDSRDIVYAKEIANLWAAQTINSLKTAYMSLHSHVDDFTRETVDMADGFTHETVNTLSIS